MRQPIPSYRLYGEADEDRGDFWLHCETIPERTHLHNWEIALHRHEQFFQIFHLPQGSGEILLGREVLAFAAPALVFIPPGFAHGFRFARDIDGLVLTALADRFTSLASADRGIARFGAELRVIEARGDDPHARRASEAVEGVFAEFGRRNLGGALVLELLTTLAIVSLARAAGDRDAAPAEDRDRRRVEELVALVDTHYRARPSVTFLAGRVGLSPAHLNRLARTVTGSSVQGLMDRRTLEAARRDLVFTPTPVQAIAYSLGFSDPAYFNRFFRRHTGLTPGAFRDRERRRLAV